MKKYYPLFLRESDGIDKLLIGNKICRKCGKRKNLDQFPFGSWKVLVDGIRGKYQRHVCKSCKTNQAITWVKNNYSRHCQNARKWTKKNHHKLKQLAINKLGGICVRCGFSDRRALQIDHVNGDGAKERKIGMINSTSIYKKVLADKENKYQLLCANCNWIKRVENNENGQ